MANLNSVMLSGRVVRDPEMRRLAGGQAVTNFTIAATRRYAGLDGVVHQAVEYIPCVAWDGKRRQLAHEASALRKGALISAEGRLTTRSWEGQDGQKRRATEVVLSDFEDLGKMPSLDEMLSQATGPTYP